MRVTSSMRWASGIAATRDSSWHRASQAVAAAARYVAAAAVVCAGILQPAVAGERAAVVLANEMFAGKTMPMARADGELMAKTLRELGFDVLLVQNLRQADVPSTVQAIGQHLAGSSLAFVYAVGVGVPTSTDVVLQPVDAGPAADPGKGIALEQLAGDPSTRPKTSILVVDGVPVAGAGLSVRRLQRQTATAADPGKVLLFSGATSAGANDNAGTNGIFATVLANALSQGGVSLQDVFRETRRNVREATLGGQLPLAEGILPPDIVLKPLMVDPLTAQERPSLDQIFWTLIKGSADEADYRLFEATFPASTLGERAAARRIALASATVADVGRLTRSVSGSVPGAGPSGAAGDQSLALGASIDRVPPSQVRTWPSSLPKTSDGLASLATACDAVAGDPDDPMRLSPGTQWNLVNLRVAVRTCIPDLARNPQDRRLLFLTGRLLDMLKFHVWAESFYREAARLGYSAAYANLAYLHMTGRGRPVDMKKANPYLRLGADLGNPRCRTDLGFNYLNGFGVEKSTAEALLWLRLAAASGWPNALDILANMYMTGTGVPKDDVAADELFQASAWVGNTNAMSSMGRRYLEGKGIPRDPAMAKTWFERAIRGGNAFAPLYLGIMYRDGDGVPKNPVKAVEYMQLSADRGFGEARLRLGEMYEVGVGVGKDLQVAAFNYMLTDRQTFEHPVNQEFIVMAREKLKLLLPRLTPTQLKAVQARVEEFRQFN